MREKKKKAENDYSLSSSSQLNKALLYKWILSPDTRLLFSVVCLVLSFPFSFQKLYVYA